MRGLLFEDQRMGDPRGLTCVALGTYILYEALWGCNIAVLLVIMAVFLSKPFLVGVAVCIRWRLCSSLMGPVSRTVRVLKSAKR